MNAGGFLLVGRYTSHVTGVISALADDLVLGALGAVLAGLAALLAFTLGAALSAILIHWGRRHSPAGQYALPMRLEAALLALAGLFGPALHGAAPLLAVPLLCLLMGLQNATITKISGARIRTTHMTGLVTDIGIELGKLCYWNRRYLEQPGTFVRADRTRLALLGSLLGCFLAGGVAGALGFARFGFPACLPLALLLLLLARAAERR